MYRHTSFYCASQVLHLFFTNERPDPSSAKDYDSLYCNIDFIVVVWNQTHNVSKVCLYICKFMLVFDYYLTKIYDMIWDEMRYMICDVMWYDVMWHYMSYDMITLSEGIYQAICSEERSVSSVSWMSLSLPLSLEEVNFFSKKQNNLEAGSKSNQSTLPVGAICRMHSDTTQNRKARCLTNVPFVLLFSISKMTVVGPRKCELWNVLGRDLPKEDLPKAEPFPGGQPVWEWWPCACIMGTHGGAVRWPAQFKSSAQEHFCSSEIGLWRVTCFLGLLFLLICSLVH